LLESRPLIYSIYPFQNLSLRLRARLRLAHKKNGATHEQSLEKQALGRSRGGVSTKIHAFCEGAGKPIGVKITGGQEHDSTQVENLLDGVSIKEKKGRPRKRFKATAGDKAYDSENIRDSIKRRNGEPVIPHRRLRNGEYPEDATDFNKEKYRRRNVAERLIGRLKENRRIATRYDKLAERYKAFILLGFIKIWLKDLLSHTA
jgi:transposase